MNIRLTQLDGKLPNLALMKLSHWHKSKRLFCYIRKEGLPKVFLSLINAHFMIALLLAFPYRQIPHLMRGLNPLAVFDYIWN